MKNLKKTIAMISSVVFAASAFAACGGSTNNGGSAPAAGGNDTPAATDAPAAGGNDAGGNDAPAATEAAAPIAADADSKLTILCWNTDDVNPMVETFCKLTDHTADEINIKNFACMGGEAAENYDQYLSNADNDADIMFVEADWCLKYINDDNVTKPLSDINLDTTNIGDFYPYTVEIGKSTKTGVQKGLSWQAAAGGFCYRTDLAEQYLNVKSPDEFQPLVSDWDKFVDTAARVYEVSGGETALTSTLGGVWQVFSAARTNPWVKDNKLQLDDECKKYMELAKKMYDNGYVIKDLTQWGDGWAAAGVTNKTMGYFVSTWGFGDAILTSAAGGKDGETFGKWNVCVGPKPFYWGGTWLTVPTRNNNPELTKEFIEFFTVNADTAKEYALFKGDYVSNKKAMEAIIAEGSYAGEPVLGGQNQFEVLNVVADKVNMAGGITEYDSIVKGCFNDVVTGYCNGTYATTDEAIAEFALSVAGNLPDLDYSDFE